MLWDATSECVGHLKCMQPLMYSHALLATWGQPVYLSLADHDEYLALPNPGRVATVQDLITKPGCFNGLTQVCEGCFWGAFSASEPGCTG